MVLVSTWFCGKVVTTTFACVKEMTGFTKETKVTVIFGAGA